ncbi:MAG: hypothetical protein J2P17_22490 [Mycobacterium sp.]|nr:hypothetical protein [Mycobacterium sp.]
MAEESLIAIDLTERERSFIVDWLREWRGSASWKPLPSSKTNYGTESLR